MYLWPIWLLGMLKWSADWYFILLSGTLDGRNNKNWGFEFS